jgi:hypothetical protein
VSECFRNRRIGRQDHRFRGHHPAGSGLGVDEQPPYVFGLVRLHALEQHLSHFRGEFGDQVSRIIRIHFLQDVRRTLGVELGDQLDLFVLWQFLQSVGQLAIIECGSYLGSSLARHFMQFASDVGRLHVLHLSQQLIGTLTSLEAEKRDCGPVHDCDVTSPAETAAASGFP